jgi:hypothetical protein
MFIRKQIFRECVHAWFFVSMWHTNIAHRAVGV